MLLGLQAEIIELDLSRLVLMEQRSVLFVWIGIYVDDALFVTSC